MSGENHQLHFVLWFCFIKNWTRDFTIPSIHLKKVNKMKDFKVKFSDWKCFIVRLQRNEIKTKWWKSFEKLWNPKILASSKIPESLAPHSSRRSVNKQNQKLRQELKMWKIVQIPVLLFYLPNMIIRYKPEYICTYQILSW